jgi:hypothetical protein
MNNIALKWKVDTQNQKYVDKYACRTSHSKSKGINMELVPSLLLQQPLLFWEDFPLDVGTLLQGYASIQSQEHL